MTVFPLLLALAAVGQPPAEVAIYPGNTRSELPKSVAAVTRAAAACVKHGEPADPLERIAVRRIEAEIVDGVEVVPTRSTARWACQAEPVTECTFTLVTDVSGADVGYAAIECIGSHDDERDLFRVSTTVDIERAKRASERTAKGAQTLVVAFFTSTFPGTEAFVYTRVRRSDGKVLDEPEYTQLDDYTGGDLASVSYTAEQVRQMSDQIRRTVREIVEHPGLVKHAR